MKPVTRGEILGLAEYEKVREQFRSRVIEEKRARRVLVGDRVSAIFENHDTVLLQIQELLRTERITRDGAIQHEIDTYNQSIPGDGALSATVMIEIPDKDAREAFLTAARGFEKHVALLVDGERISATWEKSRELETRASAVNYLRFPLSKRALAHVLEKKKDARIEVLVDHPEYAARAKLSPATAASLAEDLAE
ncbi:MAG TPA: DUF3501 family protein [Polyangiaceae bacterium]|jgi:hypothetical protein